MKKYQIWEEGYATNGNSATAKFLGEHKALSFRLACIKALIANKYGLSDYNIVNNTNWGCSFYDNEIDARKNFG